MPKILKPLSALQVSRLGKPGAHFVGGAPGLVLRINLNGARSWLLRITDQNGKRVDRGLGSDSWA